MSNITQVTFTTDKYAVTEPLYQYDYGQILKISSPGLPDPYTVHFGNLRSRGESLTVIGTAADGAAIPSSLLATGLSVFAWVFLHTGENDGETEYMVEIPVIKRAEPTDDPVVEEDPSAVDIIMGEIASLKSDLSGWSDDTKTALLNAFAHVAWTDANGQTYYDALEDALYPVAPATLESITAVYTQSGTIYPDASLDDLKADLVVTAHYSDGTDSVISSGYTLSGTLATGTSTITVTYQDKTTTFTVTVTAPWWSYSWEYKPSDGLLSAQSYVNFTKSSGFTGFSESVENNTLKISVAQDQTTRNAQFNFTPSTFTNRAEVKYRIKVASIGYNVASTDTSNGLIAFRLSDGTKGASVGLAKYDSLDGDLKLRPNVGNVATWANSITMNEWHDIIIICQNDKQTVTVDGNAVVTDEAPSTLYTTDTKLIVFTSPSNNCEYYLDSITYKSN